MDFKVVATQLLDDTNIINIFSNFGTVYTVGSYAFDLMTNTDIDLLVVTNTPQESSEQAVSYLVTLHAFQKIEYGDFKNFPRDNRPPFFIVNARLPINGVMWEIETWFVTPEAAQEKLEFTNRMKNITQVEREEILRLKNERDMQGTSKHSISSYEIYKKVLGL